MKRVVNIKKIVIFATVIFYIAVPTKFINASGFEVSTPLRYRISPLDEAGFIFNIMKNEIWKDIPDYEGLYQVSNLGKIKGLERKSPMPCNGINAKRRRIGKILLPSGAKNKKGYYHLSLYCKGSKTNHTVHRLIASAFIPNPENKPQINHKNGIKTDNRIGNLEWCTLQENMIHATNNGLRARGEKITTSKLTEKDVLEIRNLNTQGHESKKLANQFNVYASTINRIISRKAWRHI